MENKIIKINGNKNKMGRVSPITKNIDSNNPASMPSQSNQNKPPSQVPMPNGENENNINKKMLSS
jgi:hypothetical protein